MSTSDALENPARPTESDLSLIAAELIVVDEECAGEDWWTSVQSTVPDDEDVAEVRRQLLAASGSSVQGTSDAFDRFFAWASTLPGWLGGPEHARSPVFRAYDE